KDYSSHDVVAVLRGILKTRKIGHSGTLDPDATGLLVIGIGNGTKIMRFLNRDKKRYEATVCVGKSTTTLDDTGEENETKKVADLTNVDLILESFLGDYVQTPPMYSAIKYKGKRLYEYARKGIVIENIPSRTIQIETIKRTSPIQYQDDCAYFDYQVTGSKGLYVRTLSYDIAKKLGYPGYNYSLNRTGAGMFSLDNAYTLDQIQNGDYTIISLSDALEHMPKVIANKKMQDDVKYGRLLSVEKFPHLGPTRVVDNNNRLLAIYQKHPERLIMKPTNVFLKD
ncbi:MAG: tRNA pseudouridine(55) synthase TruB, partial [Candidatus Izimaplasma sp.]|nr:tRNA pseudouridine(55) synthase TruB [Candidatus Izimaplasma bacterium]